LYYGNDKLMCDKDRAKTVEPGHMEETVKYWGLKLQKPKPIFV
jgi:hypothetical protein